MPVCALPVTNVRAVAGMNQVTVTWAASENAEDAEVTNYYVQVLPEGRIAKVDADTLTAVVSGLKNGVAVEVIVHAASERGRSLPSKSVTVTPTNGMEGEVGGLIVKFEAGTDVTAGSSDMPGADRVDGIGLTADRELATDTHLVELSESVSLDEAKRIAADLAADPKVKWAEPDEFVFVSSTQAPDDPQYATEQWNLWDEYGIGLGDGASRTTSAYDLNAGAGTTVAVIDTGITAHPDLDGQLVDGYDFVSDPDALAAPREEGGAPVRFDADGQSGWDADPTDPGDWRGVAPARNSTWHGTHIAGIIAAKANNAEGIAGIAPGTKVQPIRALSWRGGLISDIAAAITWASGGTVDGVAATTKPADVINMSFTMQGPCSVTLQTAIDGASERGSVLVAAAGNANDDVANYAPANCNNVISVGATGRDGKRAPYSNWGAGVDISAPGGSMSGDGGVLSTSNSGARRNETAGYAAREGTSIAAAHVSAAVARMRSLNSTLSPAVITTRVVGTEQVRAFASDQCDAHTGKTCGAGIVSFAQAAATTTLTATCATTSPGNVTSVSIAPGDTLEILKGNCVQGQVGFASPTVWGQFVGAALPSVGWGNLGSTTTFSTITAGTYSIYFRIKSAGSGGIVPAHTVNVTVAAAATPFTTTYAPAIFGTAEVGQTLTATTADWDPVAAMTYQWFAGGSAISGATGATHVVQLAQVGKAITVKATGALSGYKTTTVESSATSVVPATPVVITLDPNGGQVTSTSISAMTGTAVTLPDPTKGTYTFAGWWTASSGGSQRLSGYSPSVAETLYARWKSTLTLDASSGSVSPTALDVLEGQQATLPTPTRTNHRFAGWYTDPSAGTKRLSGYVPTGSETLYARWVPVYTVSFNGNGMINVPSAVLVDVGTPMSVADLPVQIPSSNFGIWSFLGWYDGDDPVFEYDSATGYTLHSDFVAGGGWKPGAWNTAGASATLTAHWTRRITVYGPTTSTGAGAGATLCTGTWLNYTATMTSTTPIPTITLGIPSGVSAEFVSWFASRQPMVPDPSLENDTTRWATQPSRKPVRVYGAANELVGLRVHVDSDLPESICTSWSATTTFNPGAGTVGTPSQSAALGSRLSAPTPQRPGYGFAGWYNAAIGGTQITLPADPTYYSNASRTLHARWTANSNNTAVFNSQGGSSVAGQTWSSDQGIAEPSAPTRSGFTFAGWAETVNGSPVAFASGRFIPSTFGNVTLYARWTANSYTAVFDSRGGSAVAGQTWASDQGIAEPSAPARAGFTFAGWAETVDGGAVTFTSGRFVPSTFGAVTLYARWSANSNTAVFDSQGGSAVAGQTWSSDQGIAEPLAPTRAGYAFAGWAESANGSAVTFTSGRFIPSAFGAVTLYARWSANSNTAVFDSQGGSAVAGQTWLSDQGIVQPAAPQRAGFTFRGWAETANGNLVTFPFVPSTFGTVTMFAQWQANPVPEPASDPVPNPTTSGAPAAKPLDVPPPRVEVVAPEVVPAPERPAVMVVDGRVEVLRVERNEVNVGLDIEGDDFTIAVATADVAGNRIAPAANASLVAPVLGQVQVQASGYVPDSMVSLYLIPRSSLQLRPRSQVSSYYLGEGRVRADQTLVDDFRLPDWAGAGEYVLQINGYTDTGSVRSINVQLDLIDVREMTTVAARVCVFPGSQVRLAAQCRQSLRSLAQLMPDEPTRVVLAITGVAYAQGDAERNERVAERRAKGIRQFLAKVGVSGKTTIDVVIDKGLVPGFFVDPPPPVAVSAKGKPASTVLLTVAWTQDASGRAAS